MTWADYVKVVRAAAVRMGIKPGPEMAMLLASMEIECRALSADHPSLLALSYNNLFGIKFLPGDDKKGYGRVDMPPNQYEPAGESVAYRVYQSPEHCIENWLWHRDRSTHYLSIKERAYAVWAHKMAEKWAEGNPDHAREVETLYWKHITKEPRD